MTLLKVTNLSKSFIQGSTRIEVLREVNFEINAMETKAIIGKSGSGKSTLLSLIAGLDRPDEGSINLDGQEITSLDERDLAKLRGQRMGIVFQQFHLMSNFTALENVMLPLEILGFKDADALARQALADVGLGDRLTHLPQMLSGGEKQRVAIARAIIHKPSLLIADEPSGNLDNETGESVMKLLFDLIAAAGMSMILVTHSPEWAQHCQATWTLKNGVLKPYV